MKSLLRPLALASITALIVSACGGGGGSSSGGVPVPRITPTVAPTSTPVVTQSATCPTTGATPQSFSLGSARGSNGEIRRPAASADGSPRFTPDLLEVTYARSAFAANEGAAQASESSVGASKIRQLDFPNANVITRIVRVTPEQNATAMQTLRRSPGVTSVARVQYRYAMSAPAYHPVNDPYFNGFNSPAPPYYEAASSPGQWDMHAIAVDRAWGYALPAATNFNPSIISGATIGMIDTGADLTHPDLGSHKVVYTHCFITLNGVATTGNFVTDVDGHGTNTAGIASSVTNNAFGFVGVGFNSHLIIERIFPSPPQVGCPTTSTDPQCAASSADEALAIQDAVNHGARVVSLSLGAVPDKTTGTCSDPVELQAVQYAQAHGAVVVAASGNENAPALDCPSAYPGVIAVGASALNDPAGAPITEKVANYSNYVPGTDGGLYLVAPGGEPDASGSKDQDDLHWIENIYSSTAPEFSPPNKACTPDFGSNSGPADCRVLIAGTSQATPHVAGAVALLLAAGATPGSIPGLLCSTADNIGDVKQGCGRLNVYHAVAKQVGDPNP
ncbi:MAG: S8 family serine peptidase [Candidatus Eremiobacteraeota bacterium]|nr:S8 family serine peptidase [Candidatus Eremiobacteraeota bacterium]